LVHLLRSAGSASGRFRRGARRRQPPSRSSGRPWA